LDSINTSQGDQPIQSPGQMPLVCGMRIDIAEATIKLAIPSPEIVIEHRGSHTPPDTVSAQRPMPGAVLKPGSQVTLWVSVQP
jgi:beta-lactam-binding protein with PASTA domain